MTVIDTSDQQAEPADSGAGAARLGIGLVQGLWLWLLSQAAQAKMWPAIEPALFAPLFLIGLWIPLIPLAAWGRMRARTLLIWTGAATLILAGLAVHDALRAAGQPGSHLPFPSPILVCFSAAGLFIAHNLIAAADHDRRRVGLYPTHFDLAWKHAVQLALAGLFVLVFWGVLWLGAALFEVIGISAFRKLLSQEWFQVPATTLAFAGAAHLTDVRTGLIRGVRTVVLTLLSWLTPVMAGIAAAFLIALPFTGLQPLWETRAATAILLSAAAVLIVLINTVYQDGERDGPPPAVLAWTGRVAAVVLVPIVVLAGYALSLRIGQYGLTPERVIAAACVLVGAVHAGGYAFAAVRPGPFMKPLETTNVVGAWLTLAVLLALFSPLADPTRLSVNDQMARLAAGKVKAEDFDYQFLRFDAGKAGQTALKKLGRSTDLVVREKAAAALALEHRSYAVAEEQRTRLSAADLPLARNSAPLPASFLAQDWEGDGAIINCTRQSDQGSRGTCRALVTDMTGDGQAEVLVFGGWPNTVYRLDADGRWKAAGSIPNTCGDWRERLDAGEWQVDQPAFRDLSIGGVTARIQLEQRCPPTGPRLPFAP